MVKILIKNIVFWSLATFGACAASANPEPSTTEYSTEQLGQLAVSYVIAQDSEKFNENYEVSALPLDSRIGNKRCQSPLQFSIANDNLSRQQPVQVRCDDEQQQWQLFVQVRIEQFQWVLVAKNNINKGTILTQADVAKEKRPSYLVIKQASDEIASVLGAKAKRHIASGQVLSSSAFCLICKGQSVTIVAKINGLIIKTQGIASEDGILNEMINVVNSQSEKRLKATVRSSDEVEVNL